MLDANANFDISKFSPKQKASSRAFFNDDYSDNDSNKRGINWGPVHTYPDNFESATFSFRIQKYFHPHLAYSNWTGPSTRIRNLVLRTSQENRGNRACAMKPSVAILRIDFTVRNWARSCSLLRRPDKNIRIWRPHGSGFISDSKLSTLESVFKKLRIRQRIRRIRVDGRKGTLFTCLVDLALEH